jgi:hypothetical protein
MTLIDLPGYNYLASYSSYECYFKNLNKYCRSSDTLIICALHASCYNSICLAQARDLDATCGRIIGVVSKVDLMDRGTDISELVTNNFIMLPRGYIALKNRSYEEVENHFSLQASF